MVQLGVSSVITGASRVDQLIDNMGAADINISGETMRRLDLIYGSSLLRKLKRRLRFLLPDRSDGFYEVDPENRTG